MFLQSSYDELRKTIRRLLVTFLVDEAVNEATALDLIELITSRLPSREDYQIAAIGTFVRLNLLWLENGLISACQLIERFTNAAAHSVLGHAALVESLTVETSRRSSR